MGHGIKTSPMPYVGAVLADRPSRERTCTRTYKYAIHGPKYPAWFYTIADLVRAQSRTEGFACPDEAVRALVASYPAANERKSLELVGVISQCLRSIKVSILKYQRSTCKSCQPTTVPALQSNLCTTQMSALDPAWLSSLSTADLPRLQIITDCAVLSLSSPVIPPTL